jgi:hypothetical protein
MSLTVVVQETALRALARIRSALGGNSVAPAGDGVAACNRFGPALAG